MFTRKKYCIGIVLVVCTMGCSDYEGSELYLNDSKPKMDTIFSAEDNYSNVAFYMTPKDSINYAFFKDTCMMSGDFDIYHKTFDLLPSSWE